MGTFASEWGPFVEQHGQPVNIVTMPPLRPVTDNPDTPVSEGHEGLPFWVRLWTWSVPGNGPAAKAVVTTEDKAREIVTNAKAGLSGALDSAKGLGTRVIIILALVLIGFLIVNQVIARRVAA